MLEIGQQQLQAAMDSLQLIKTKSPQAISICKKVINSTFGLTTAEALKIEKLGFREAFESEEKIEGTTAFLEKRPANF